MTPWTAARQASLSETVSRNMLKLMSIESVIPSISYSVICFSSCLQSFPASGSFPVSKLFASGGQSIRASTSQYQSFQSIFMVDFLWIDWFVQGTLKSLLQHHSSKASILQRSAFFMVQLSHLDMTTGKTITLSIWTLISKVMFLHFKTLPRFVIPFLPRNKHLLNSWLQLPSQ